MEFSLELGCHSLLDFIFLYRDNSTEQQMKPTFSHRISLETMRVFYLISVFFILFDFLIKSHKRMNETNFMDIYEKGCLAIKTNVFW
jgi:hypothetical protein